MHGPSSLNEPPDPAPDESVTTALTPLQSHPCRFTPRPCTQRYQELLVTWHPHRYANLTNNPTRYMQMYKKGEAMTKEIQAAYRVLKEWNGQPGRHAPFTLTVRHGTHVASIRPNG